MKKFEMATHFGVEMLPSGARNLLRHGERPVAWEMATFLGGANRAGKSEKPRAVTGVSADPITGGIQSDPDFFDVALSGAGASGAEGSRADQFMRAFPDGGGILLTTQRLGALDYSVTGKGVAHLWIPRKEIVSIERAPRLLQRGRIAITFTDGSVLRPTLGILSPRAARRFLAGWSDA